MNMCSTLTKIALFGFGLTNIIFSCLAEEVMDAKNRNANQCTVLRWDSKSFNKPSMHIEKPGRYCLDRDYSFACYPWTHGCGGKFIQIWGGDVDVDLRGHTLSVTGTRGYTGIWGLGKNIRVHNGTIKGAGTGIYLVDKDGKGKDPVYAYPAWPIEPGPQFAETNFVVENITFIDVHSPILMSGAGNVIRNSEIRAILDNRLNEDGTPKFSGENEPKVAVLNYGPKIFIEGNKIIQDTDNRGIAAYSIYLRHADGAIVRNNRIRIDGARERTIAIGLSASHDVRIEKNQIARAELPVESKDGSNAIEIDNDINPIWIFW